MNHTPGPWFTHGCQYDHSRCSHRVVDDPVYARTETGSKLVASATELRDSREQHANARLIAQAPAMLEALEGIADYLEGLGNDSFIWCNHPHGEQAKRRFASALRSNADRARAILRAIDANA